MGWWAAGVMLSSLQYVSGVYSVSRYSTTILSVVRAGGYFLRTAVRWLQGTAYGVLPQEYVGRVPEIFVDESGWGCVVCSWGWSQVVHVAAQVLYEEGCLDLRGSWYQELTGDSQGLVVDELCCG
jgi:hypothetical protein